ncbi:MAG TPA: TadE family protein [Anaerolineales bacterium]|nr:TadE family protein [Anaerolineales bacterium]
MKPGSRYHINLFKHLLLRFRRQPRGQSFVELMFVMLFLALLLSGMVEFGFLLNNYLHVLDGTREAARYSSSSTPFNSSGVSITGWYVAPFFYQAAGKAAQTMDPVWLNPTNPDDIVISVFSLDGNVATRFPSGDPDGWSLCAHYNQDADAAAENALGDPTINGIKQNNIEASEFQNDGHNSCVGQVYSGFAAYFPCLANPTASVPAQLPVATWGAGCTVRTSQFTAASLKSVIDSTGTALHTTITTKTGVVVVEIYYNYPQLLKLPVLTAFLADPVPLYLYSVMPLWAAQPTQVP